VKGVIGAKIFKKADPDNDGTLTKDEYLATRNLRAVTQPTYSASNTPEPPISFGKSFCFGNPSLILRTFSP
jgi:hypothetical protein